MLSSVWHVIDAISLIYILEDACLVTLTFLRCRFGIIIEHKCAKCEMDQITFKN